MKKKPAQQPAKTVKQVTEPKTNYNFILGGLVILTAILYSNSLHNDILNFDDVEYFNVYPEVLQLSWESIVKYFSGYYVLMYQPLPILTFAVNYAMSGMDPMPMHLLNLSFHLANIILVYHFIKQLSNKPLIGLIVAGLFALHPMNVEAISWISARSSTMYTCFYLLALLNYVKYCKNDFKPKYILYTGIFFLLSLFSKAQAVTLPVVLLLLDYFYHRKITKRLILEKIPFFILSVIFGLITLMDPGTMKNITNGMMISYSPVDMFFMLCYSFMFYFFKLVLPISLCSIYVYPPKVDGLLPWIYYASPVVFAGILFLLYKYRKNRNIVLGIGLFFITVSINIQIIPSRLFIVTERYAYFPYLGLFFIIAYLYNLISESENTNLKKYSSPFIMVLAASGLFYSYTIWERNQVWANDLVFMTDVIEKNPRVPYMARAYGNRGNYYLNNGMPNESIADFSEAIKLRPTEAQSYYNRAVTYIKLNKLPEAYADLELAKKYNPVGALIYSNLAFIKFMQRDNAGALEAANTCIKLDPNIPEAYNIRAAIEFMNKDNAGSERDLNKAISLKPDFGDAYKNRGILYMNTGRKGQACDDFNKAQMYGNADAAGLIQMNCK